MTVINLDDYRPHLSGELKCNFCGHSWIGVCLVDPDGSVPSVECPECGKHQGFYIYPVLPVEGEEIYKCNCGGELFTIYKSGAMCIKCGLLHELFSL